MVAQTLNISPNPLNISAQVNAQASASLSLTSSGAPITNISLVPAVSWLHVSPQTVTTTPATVTVTVDPMTASPQPGSISILSSAGNASVPVNLTVSTIGVSPSSLTFPYVAGSTSSPVAQNVALSVPAGTNFHVDVATNSGGAWLQAGVPVNSPNTLTVLINTIVAQTLLSGTYTGTISITPTSGSNAAPAVVQVTLTATAAAVVTFTPAALTYNYQTGGTNNATSQTLQLTGGTEDASFVFNGDPWITANPASGVLRANQNLPVTVTITPPSSFVPSPNPYTGNLAFNSTGSPKNIPVTVNVSSSPLLNVDLTPLTFSYQVGGSVPGSRTVATSSTSTALAYSLTASTAIGGNWLSALPQGAATTPNPVTVSVDPAKLAPGTYTGTVAVTATGGPPQQIPVTLKVTNDPQLIPSASSLSFVYQYNRPVPQPPQTLLLTSNGIPLGYTATSNAPWLIVIDQGSGTTDGSLIVSVNPASVATGANQGRISIAVKSLVTGASLGTVVVPVTLFVDTAGLLAVNPIQPVVFTVAAGSATSQRQDVQLTSTSATDLIALSIGTPKTDSGGAWLGILAQPSATPGTLTLIAAPPASLAPGTYTGSVTVTATGGPSGTILDSPYVIQVVLQVTAGTISTSSPPLKFVQAAGGPVPQPQLVTVVNDGPPLNFFATGYDGGLGWLSVSGATGSVTPGPISISVDGSRLTVGQYTGRVIVTSPFAAGSPLIIPVTLTVTPGAIFASAARLTFTQAAGAPAPPSQPLTITGSPNGLVLVATAAGDNGSWLKTPTPASAPLPATFQVAVDAGSLPAGTYTGKVTIADKDNAVAPLSVPVTLTVVASQPLNASPLTLNFSYTVGQPAPPSQQLQIFSPAFTIPFTAEVSNSAPWLQVTPGSGSTPSTVSISVDPRGITSAGNLVGLIKITSPNSVTAVTVSVNLAVTVGTTPATPTVNALLNAGSYQGGAVSPGENVVIFGTGIGPADLVLGSLNAAGRFDTTAGNTRVLFDGVAAPVIYASAVQTSVMVPYGVDGRATTTVRVEYQGVAGSPVTYNVAATAPGIYTLNRQGTGQGAVLNQDGITGNTDATPAAKGSVIAVYMTGEGQTNPAGTDGAIAPGVASGLKVPKLPVTATVGGVEASVKYYGSAPGIVNGVMQVNVEIPLSAPSGANVPIVINVGSSRTQAGVTVAIQ